MIYKVEISNNWSQIEQVFSDYKKARNFMDNFDSKEYNVSIMPLDFKTVDEYGKYIKTKLKERFIL